MAARTINGLWGQIIADELAAAGVDTAVLAPGSRSTPLTVALATHSDIDAVSQLDERSAAFFALGYGKRTGAPAALVCTSGTALANFHPAVIEADMSRVPMVLLTADRPPELADSGANQTIDQDQFYGDSVRLYRKLPEPEAADRKLRSLRTTISRAVGTATGGSPGPIHLDVPLRKPLEPHADPESIPDGVPDGTVSTEPDALSELATTGRDGPFVRITHGVPTLSDAEHRQVSNSIEDAAAGLIVCGPTDQHAPTREAVVSLARGTGFPIVADPLSGHRFGAFPDDVVVCGGYDGYIGTIDVTPDAVVRFGASPTSKPLRQYLSDSEARQFLVDPAGEWRESTFTATDLVVADETAFAEGIANTVDRNSGTYAETLAKTERRYWSFVQGKEPPEGAVLADTVEFAPDPATIFVSNSMPVRELDRFGRPRNAELSVLGNRGASGIDGIVSSALGAGYGTDDPLALVTGDLAYYHDMNGLLAVSRAGVDATIVCINNDGGGIFNLLPIEEHDTFEEWFRTPHGLDFEHSAALYELEFARTDSRDRFRELYSESVGSAGTQVIEFRTDSQRNHDERRALDQRVRSHLED